MKQAAEKQHFWGYLIIGIVALSAGIVMFLKVVPGRYPVDAAPRDMQMVFTQLYSRQSILKENTGRYSADFREMLIPDADCQRFGCRLQVNPDGLDYQFLLTKDGRSWFIQSRSPVPKELGADGQILPPQKIR